MITYPYIEYANKNMNEILKDEDDNYIHLQLCFFDNFSYNVDGITREIIKTETTKYKNSSSFLSSKNENLSFKFSIKKENNGFFTEFEQSEILDIFIINKKEKIKTIKQENETHTR